MVHLTSRPVKSPVSSRVWEERCVPEHCPGGGVGKGHGRPVWSRQWEVLDKPQHPMTLCCHLIGCFTSAAGWELALQIEPVLCSFDSHFRPFLQNLHPTQSFLRGRGRHRGLEQWCVSMDLTACMNVGPGVGWGVPGGGGEAPETSFNTTWVLKLLSPLASYSLLNFLYCINQCYQLIRSWFKVAR